MFQADIRVLSSDPKKIIHEFQLNLATIPKEGEVLTIINIGHPHYAALIGKVVKVYLMLDARKNEEVQNNIAILAKLVDYVDEDVITVIVQPKSL